MQRAVDAGELRGDLDVELMDDLFLGPMLVRTIHRPDAPLPEDLADSIIQVLTEGLAPRPAADGCPPDPPVCDRSVTSPRRSLLAGTRRTPSFVLVAVRPSWTAGNTPPIA